MITLHVRFGQSYTKYYPIHNSFLVTRAMVLKKIDNRIRVLIENGVQKRHRSLFVVVGDKGKDQVSYEIKFFLLLGLTVFAKQ